MRTARLLLTSAALLAWATASTMGQMHYDFNKTDGVWYDAANWSPDGGPPGANDTASVGDGRTCHVVVKPGPPIESAWWVKELDVQAGATVTVRQGVYFYVGTNAEGAVAQMTVNGTVRFDRPSAGSPQDAPSPRCILHS